MRSLIGAAFLLRTAAATAEEEPRIALVWDGPAECPSGQEAIAKVESLLGAPLGSLPDQNLRFEARLSRSSGSVPTYGIELRVTSDESSSERRFEDTNCTLVMEAAALVIALAIDPEKVEARQRALESDAVSEGAFAAEPANDVAASAIPPSAVESPSRARPSQSPAPPRSLATSPGPEVPAPVSNRDATRSPTLAKLGARFEVAFPMLLGVVSPASVGIEGGLGLTLEDAWYFLGTGDYWFLGTETVPEAAGARLELSGFGGELRLCHAPARSGWGLEACGGVSAASLAAQGIGLAPSRHARAWWWGPFAELGWSLPLTGALGVRGAVFGGAAVSRPRLGVSTATGQLVVVEPEPWFAGAQLGVVYVLD